MAKVKATAHSGQGYPIATLEIDGIEIRECTGYSLDVPLDGIPTVKCSALATDGFSFDVDASVQFTMTMLPDYGLTVESLPDGRTRYRVHLLKPQVIEELFNPFADA